MTCRTCARLHLFPIFQQRLFRASLLSGVLNCCPSRLSLKEYQEKRTVFKSSGSNKSYLWSAWFVNSLGIIVLQRAQKKHWNSWADTWVREQKSLIYHKYQGESRGQVLIMWMSQAVKLRLFQGSWKLSCYFANVSLLLSICLSLSFLFVRRAATSDARLRFCLPEGEQQKRSKRCLWCRQRGESRTRYSGLKTFSA